MDWCCTDESGGVGHYMISGHPAVEPLPRAWGITARGHGPWWPLDDGQDSIREAAWQQEVLANVVLIKGLISSPPINGSIIWREETNLRQKCKRNSSQGKLKFWHHFQSCMNFIPPWNIKSEFLTYLYENDSKWPTVKPHKSFLKVHTYGNEQPGFS